MEQDHVEKFYTVSELSQMTNLPKSSIYAMVNEGYLRPSVRNNRTRYYSYRDFNRAKDARLKSLNDEDRRGFIESTRGRSSV